jgi:ABC-type transport system involved in multi-copper enzyme maturation permease subunit
MLSFSPILNRELLTFLRRKRAFGGLLLFLVVLAAATGICWWTSLLQGNVTARDLLSRRLFHTVMITQLIAFSCYALILTCTKINGERDEKTLDLLVTAPLSSLHVVLAKYVSALTVIVLLVFASAPFLGLCFLLGGVSGREVLSAYTIVVLAVLAYGMVGMACSALFRKNYVALGAGFLVVLFFYIGVLLSALILETMGVHLTTNSWAFGLAFGMFLTTSPLGAYIVACSLQPPPPMPFVPPVMLLHTIGQMSVFIVSLLIAWRGFCVIAGRAERRARRRKDLSSLARGEEKQGDVAALPAKPPSRAKRRRAIGDRINPVYARENRLFLSRRWKHRLLRYAAAAVVFFAVGSLFREMFLGRSYSFENMCVLGVMIAIAAALFVPFLAARMVTSERETGSLALLVATPLRPRQVLWGKLAVVLKYSFAMILLFSFLVTMMSFALPIATSGGSGYKPLTLRQGADALVTSYGILLRDWVKIVLPLLVIALYFATVGLFYSVVCRKTVAAIAWTYGTILILAFSPFFIFLLFGFSPRSDDLTTAASTLFPIVSPAFYFIPEESVNLMWYKNGLWTAVLSYCTVMCMVCGVIYMATESIFAHKYYWGVRRAARGLVDEP